MWAPDLLVSKTLFSADEVGIYGTGLCPLGSSWGDCRLQLSILGLTLRAKDQKAGLQPLPRLERSPLIADSSPLQASYPGSFPLREKVHKGSRSGHLYPQLPSRLGCEAGGGVRSGAGRKAKELGFPGKLQMKVHHGGNKAEGGGEGTCHLQKQKAGVEITAWRKDFSMR